VYHTPKCKQMRYKPESIFSSAPNSVSLLKIIADDNWNLQA
jgi:hypothetical protein